METGQYPSLIERTRLHTVAANTYVAYRSLRGRLSDTALPPKLDPLGALVVRLLWLNGSSLGMGMIRGEFALPPSTLSSAIRRLEDRGFVRPQPNLIDARFVDVVLTKPAQPAAPDVARLINELDSDVRQAVGPGTPMGLEQIAVVLAAMDEEGP